MKLISCALVALALAGCAGMRGERTARAEARSETTPARGGDSLEELTRNARWEAGQLLQVTDDELRLRAYPRRGGAEARLELAEPEVPVFVEGARVGRGALRQGEDVRVYLEDLRGANPRVIAVEVLSEDQASHLREPR